MKRDFYILRHAEAHPGFPDETRALTEKGRKDCEQMGKLLKGSKTFQPQLAIHSGLTRAAETAELFLEAAGLSKLPLEVNENLSPESSVKKACKQFENLDVSAIIVGHHPHLGMLASLMLTGEIEELCVQFKKCGLLALRKPDGEDVWSLRWYLTPALVNTCLSAT